MCFDKWFKKENIPIFVQIIPIFVLVAILSIFLFQQIQMIDIENKNQESLKESLIIEIDENLRVTQAFHNVLDRIRNTNEAFGGRFSTIVLEEAIKDRRFGLEEITLKYQNGTVIQTKTKNILRKAHASMTHTNRLLDTYTGFFIIGDDPNIFNDFLKTKEDNYDLIKETPMRIAIRDLNLLKIILEDEKTVINIQ